MPTRSTLWVSNSPTSWTKPCSVLGTSRAARSRHAQAFWEKHVTVEQTCPKPLSGVLADRHRRREAAIVQGLTSPVGSKR